MTEKIFTLTVSMDANGMLTVELDGEPSYDLLNRALEEVCYQVDETPVTLNKTLQLDDDGDFYEILADDDSVTELDADDDEGSSDEDAGAQVGDAADESADDGAQDSVDGNEDDESEPAASGEVANAIGD